MPTRYFMFRKETWRISSTDISMTPTRPTASEAMRKREILSCSMNEARTAVMTGTIRFSTAPLEASEREIPQVMPSWASTCPSTPARTNLPQSDHVGRTALGLERRFRISKGTSKMVVI